MFKYNLKTTAVFYVSTKGSIQSSVVTFAWHFKELFFNIFTKNSNIVFVYLSWFVKSMWFLYIFHEFTFE